MPRDVASVLKRRCCDVMTYPSCESFHWLYMFHLWMPTVDNYNYKVSKYLGTVILANPISLSTYESPTSHISKDLAYHMSSVKHLCLFIVLERICLFKDILPSRTFVLWNLSRPLYALFYSKQIRQQYFNIKTSLYDISWAAFAIIHCIQWQTYSMFAKLCPYLQLY